MWKVTPARLEKLLREDFQSELNPIVFIWGQPGIGKTQIVQQICDELGYQLVVVEVSTIHPYALSGIPIPNIRQRRVELMPLSFMSEIEKHRDDDVVLFLDDFGAADPQQQRIALSITTYRQIGDLPLPPRCRIVVATNREEDAAYVITPSFAVLNRSKHYRLVPLFDDWVSWMRRNHGDKEPLVSLVIRFLMANPSLFCWQPDVAVKKKSVAFPTPRSWTNFVVDGYKTSDLDELAVRCAAWVGDECASAFYQFCLVSESEIAEIIRNPNNITKADKLKQILILDRLISLYKAKQSSVSASLLRAVLERVENDVLGAVLPKLEGSTEAEKLRAQLSLKIIRAKELTS